MKMRSRAAPGFSLLEMLVVLMIASMALLLTAQAVGQYQRAHARGAASERAGRQYRLSESWFRASVRGLVAIPEPEMALGLGRRSDGTPPHFEGQAEAFTGTTLLPILAGQGVPTTQEWEITTGPAGTDVLLVREQGQEIRLSLPGMGQLSFVYLDRQGEIHPQWPPRTQDSWPQLPAAIGVESGPDLDSDVPLLVLASVAGPHDPLNLPYEEDEPF